MIAIPAIGALLVLAIDREYAHLVSIVASAFVFILSLLLIWAANSSGLSSLAFSLNYIPALNVYLNLQLTQVTYVLTLMTAIVFFAASIVGEYFIGKGERIYAFVFLIAEAASLGVFLAANLLLFYVFWEVAEVMMFFFIFVYGGYDKRYASIKFIIYSIMASLLLLIAIILLYVNVTPHTFDINALIGSAAAVPAATQLLVMILLLAAFMIKIPVFPFHSWLPDAHTEAPTTGSMILAGVLLKFGGYGLILMFLLVPLAVGYAKYIAIIFVFSAVYAGLVALRQTNMKRLIAYTSITDMGIVAVGVAALSIMGTDGAIYAMLSHGLAISILFLIAGTIDHLYGTLEISKVKGVVSRFPGVAYLFVIGVFAVIGIPLTAGFIGDLLIFIGAYSSFGLLGLVPLAGLFVVGAALFWLIERTFLTVVKPTAPYETLEGAVVHSGLLLLAFSIAFGVIPFVFLNVH
jgi:NADH-quinone oxidoreductase subunit M